MIVNFVLFRSFVKQQLIPKAYSCAMSTDGFLWRTESDPGPTVVTSWQYYLLVSSLGIRLISMLSGAFKVRPWNYLVLMSTQRIWIPIYFKGTDIWREDDEEKYRKVDLKFNYIAKLLHIIIEVRNFKVHKFIKEKLNRKRDEKEISKHQVGSEISFWNLDIRIYWIWITILQVLN